MTPTEVNDEKNGFWEEHQKWRYWYSNKVQPMFAVEPDPPHRIPKTLFKYYALNEHSVDALTHLYVYASHPNQLNDPSDCSEDLLDFSTASWEDLKSLYGPLFNNFMELYGGVDGLRKYSSENYKILLYKHIGILSLCGCVDNIQLWTHYTQHCGFCVEIDTAKFTFQHYGPFPINYVERLIPLKIQNNLGVATLIQTNIKLRDWKDENEYRMLVSNPEGYDFEFYEKNGQKSEQFNFGEEHDRKMRYPLSAIKSVTLAVNFLRQNGITVCPVSSIERDIVLDDKLAERVLDFLSHPKLNIPTYVAVIKQSGSITRTACDIVKLDDARYRIIEIE